MRSRLLWKVMAINLAVIGVVLLIVWQATDYLAADYLMALMKAYHISPEPIHAMFVDALHGYLIWACVAAFMLAVLLSFLLTRKVLGPLIQMTILTRDIAAGNYAVGFPVDSGDEVGQLAKAFNRMTESLYQLENLRKQLMIDVAHELRTPLTNIQGYLEGLLDGVVPASRENYKLLHEETLRLVQLVEDILQLAKADAAKDNLQLQPVNIGRLIEQGIEGFTQKFEKKAIQVAWHIETPPQAVWADPDKIARVLRNLLQNAAQYTPVGGRLDIGVQPFEGTALKFVFTNNGGEIKAVDLPHIFERFFRGEKSRSREHGGAGIGLSIVKEIVEAHRGKVGAEIAQDTITVWFTLPLV